MPSRRNTLLPLQLASTGTSVILPARRSGIPLELSRFSAPSGWPFPDLLQAVDVAIDNPLLAYANPCGPMTLPVQHVRIETDTWRVRSPDEMHAPWVHVIEAVTVLPEDTVPGLEADGDAMIRLQIRLHPLAATLAGVPVHTLMLFRSDWSEDRQYVLDWPYPQVRDALLPLIERRLRDDEKIEEDGAGGHGGLFVENEQGGLWLHPDPEQPARTLLTIARAD